MVADTCRTIPVQSRTMVNAMVNVPYRMPYNAQRPYGTMPCRARAVIELIQCTCRRTRTARSPGREERPSVHSSGFVLCRPSFKVYFLRAPRKRSGLRCLAAPRTPKTRMSSRRKWRLALVPLYAPPPDVSWDCDRYDVPKRNCKLPSSPRRVSAPHSSADTPRSPPKRYLLLPPRLWCVHCPDHSDHDPLRIRTSTSLRSSTSVSSVPKRTPRFVSVGVAPAHRSGP